MADSRFWVGSDGNDTLVFDRDLQIDGGPHVFLWNLRARDMDRYYAYLAKQNMCSIKDETISAAAINSYSEWHNTHGRKWLAEEREYVRGRLEREESEYVRRLEREESEYVRGCLEREFANTGRLHRTPPCWHCHQGLDNATDVECATCGWIICSCGACGCGRLALR